MFSTSKLLGLIVVLLIFVIFILIAKFTATDKELKRLKTYLMMYEMIVNSTGGPPQMSGPPPEYSEGMYHEATNESSPHEIVMDKPIGKTFPR